MLRRRSISISLFLRIRAASRNSVLPTTGQLRRARCSPLRSNWTARNLPPLNGGPTFKFTEAISFVVRCEDQAEVDYYWSRLTEGGSESQCGWLKDKYGLSWQIVPVQAMELIKHPKAMQAMLGMKKLDIAELERAAQS
jgi:3-demethylubiquinone-9 3-methyltransferase